MPRTPDTGPDPAERARDVADALTPDHGGTEVNRREFVTLLMAIGGGVVVGGVGGVGIGYWNASKDEVTVVRPPSEVAGADPEMLVFYPKVPIGNLDELEVGTPVMFEYPLAGQTSALVKLGRPALYGVGPDGDVVAFSTRCSHMGWPLDGVFDPENCVFGPCPGHFSTFDATLGGQVALGQATQRLPQVALVIDEEGTIYAEGVLGLIYGYRDNLKDGEPAEVTS